MINHLNSTASDNSITLIWTKPRYFPQYYQVIFSCTWTCHNLIKIKRESMVSALATAHTIENLHPASECDFVFSAVYNPASIDSGIAHSSKTLYPSKHIKSFKACKYIHVVTFNCIQLLSWLIHYVVQKYLDYIPNATESGY